jgi:hypothetical protein
MENINYTDYIFVIYSCKKNLSYSNNIYNLLKNKLEKCKIFIIYGDTTIKTNYKIIHNFIILNVKDDYDNLNYKTIELIKTINTIYPNVKGIFKCDDDIIPNINHLNTFINSDIINTIDYCGRFSCFTKTKTHFEIKLQKEINIPIVKYCGGPLYYLNKNSLDIFKNMIENKNIIMHECEDIMIGLNLNSNNVFPYDYNLYSDTENDIDKISYHNHNSGRERDIKIFNNIDNNYLIIELQGGLGNQLFQIGTALGYCEKYNKNLILSKNHIIQNTHQTFEKTINVIKILFPYIKIVNNLCTDKYYKINETAEDTFKYNPIYNDTISTVDNILLKGYFINFKYFPEIYNCSINPTNSMSKYIDKLDNFNNTYFIHIRLGDYVNNNFYNIKLSEYYTYCINKIKEQNNNARFIICTNEYGNNLDNYINNFPKDIEYIIQDKNNDELDTLYIISSCKGGICSNSSLSLIGSYFQKNKDKNYIYMPYPWVNFINGYNHDNTIDIYPEWTQIYDTLNNKIMELLYI